MGEIGRDRVANALAWEYSVPELICAYSEGLELSPVGGIQPMKVG